MALFQKKPVTSSSLPLYTVGANKTVLIIGLGNIGDKYKNTRHNVGFMVLDDFAKRNDFPAWTNKKDLYCQLTNQQMGQANVILCKPTTLVNNSGQAASAVQRFYRIYNQTTLAVYDELAIPFASLRTRRGGSDAGHNGIKSLIAHIGGDFGRLRIGIASEQAGKSKAADFVLAKFSKDELDKLPAVIKEAGVLLTEYIFGGELNHETRSTL
ncbi:MAG TPA: aminoacyl-tRNA hydrolase [Candidatus Saccharimonadales bacterium]|nr:aminoacyl-tRNA hydrolase [Candidatus Saccharimonadales bacterium]